MRTKKIMRVGMLAAMVGMMAFSLGAPAWATTGEDGPTPPALGDPGTTPLYEVQAIIVSITTGTYDLTLYNDNTLTSCGTALGIAWNAPATGTGSLQTAIQGVVPCALTVSVSKNSAGSFYKVTFTAPLGNITQMSSANAAVRTEQDGNNTGWVAPNGSGGTSLVTRTAPPHGGYSSLTDYCLQCHAVHKAPATEFALLRQSNVTSTCDTCHRLFGSSAPEAPYDSNNALAAPGLLMGSAAARSAYDLGSGALYPSGSVAPIVRGHQIGGLGNGLNGDYTLADNATSPITITSTAYLSNTPPGSEPGEYVDDVTAAVEQGASGADQAGLYCASCHTPHGEFGQMVNDWHMTEAAGTTTAAAAATSITVAGGAFDAGDVKTTIRIVGAGTAGADLWTRVAAVTSGTVIVIVDPIVTGVTGAAVSLGDEGSSVYTSSSGVYTQWLLDFDGSNGVWYRCPTSPTLQNPTIGTGRNAACTATATVSDAQSQTVYMYGYKLLSSGPNHQYDPADVRSYAVGYGGDDKAEWCGTCHIERVDGPSWHNHPGSCTRCHGNPANQSSYDFPHTSTVARLLTQLPDALCIRCHDELP